MYQCSKTKIIVLLFSLLLSVRVYAEPDFRLDLNLKSAFYLDSEIQMFYIRPMPEAVIKSRRDNYRNYSKKLPDYYFSSFEFYNNDELVYDVMLSPKLGSIFSPGNFISIPSSLKGFQLKYNNVNIPYRISKNTKAVSPNVTLASKDNIFMTVEDSLDKNYLFIDFKCNTLPSRIVSATLYERINGRNELLAKINNKNHSDHKIIRSRFHYELTSFFADSNSYEKSILEYKPLNLDLLLQCEDVNSNIYILEHLYDFHLDRYNRIKPRLINERKNEGGANTTHLH